MDRVRGEESALVELAARNPEPVPRALQGFCASSTDFPSCTPTCQELNRTFWAASMVGAESHQVLPEGWD